MVTQSILHIEGNNAAKLVQEIAKDLGSSNWYSTQTTAMSLLAISKYLEKGKVSGLEYEFSVSNGSPIRGSTDKSLVSIPVDVEALQSGNMKVKNLSGGVIFARWLQEGKPKMDDWRSESENLRMSIAYTTMEGDTIDISSIRKGTDFIVSTTVTNPGSRMLTIKDLALNQIFPSGWEVQNDGISGITTVVKNSRFDYQDIRDDRVYTFFDLKGNVSKTFKTVLTATYPGKYYMPDNKCEAMYDKEIRARVAGQIIQVTD